MVGNKQPNGPSLPAIYDNINIHDVIKRQYYTSSFNRVNWKTSLDIISNPILVQLYDKNLCYNMFL